MALFNANLILRELRKTKGLTQEQLAEGICSRSTITMIEQGKRRPDWWTFKQLAVKLGIEPEEYFNDIASEDEVEIFDIYSTIMKLHAVEDFEGFKREIEKLEQDERFNKKKESNGYRLLLNARIIFYIGGPYQDLDIVIASCLERLSLFRPGFDLNKLEDYVLTAEEVSMIDSLLEAYAQQHRYDEVIMHRKKLLDNFERRYVAMTIRALSAYAWSISFLAYTLIRAQRYEEAIEVADKGIDIAFAEDTLNRQFQDFTFCKAHALLKLGKKEEGQELMKRHLAYVYSMGKDIILPEYEQTQKEFVKDFGYKLDLTLPWVGVIGAQS